MTYVPAHVTATQALELLDQAARNIAVAKAHIAEAIRRANNPGPGRDGYPSGGSNEGTSADTTSSTEATVIARAGGHIDPVTGEATSRDHWPNDPPDVIDSEFRIVRAELAILAETADSLARHTRACATLGDHRRGRERTVTICANCGEDCLPRARRGRCDPCYQYLLRTGEDRTPPPESPVGTQRARQREDDLKRRNRERSA